MEIQCKNCGNGYGSGFAYCPYCGQKSATSRINLKRLLGEIWIALTDVDKGILRLVKDLSTRPGVVAREYVAGKRKKYLNPFSYLFLMVAVAFFMIVKFEDVALAQLDPVALSRFDSGATNKEFLQYSFRYFNIFIFLMCPVNGLIVWLFFRKNGYNYAENTVLAAYLSGQTMFFYCILLVPFFIFPGTIPVLGIICGLLLSIWYIIGILQFHHTRTAGAIVRAILVILVSQLASQQLLYAGFELQRAPLEQSIPPPTTIRPSDSTVR